MKQEQPYASGQNTASLGGNLQKGISGNLQTSRNEINKKFCTRHETSPNKLDVSVNNHRRGTQNGDDGLGALVTYNDVTSAAGASAARVSVDDRPTVSELKMSGNQPRLPPGISLQR